MANNDIIHLTIVVKGKVQGVFFRASTREKAESIGVNGSVRNLPDGSVQIEAEATREKLNRLIEWCRGGGPQQARVEEVEILEGPIRGYNEFRISR